MNFKTRELNLYNVIQFRAKLDPEQNWQKQIEEAEEYFQQVLMSTGYYPSGPVIFAYDPENKDNRVVIMTTIGNEVEVIGNNLIHFEYFEKFNLPTNYYYCQDEQEVPYAELRQKVQQDGKKIKTIYHVILKAGEKRKMDLYYDVEDNDENTI